MEALDLRLGRYQDVLQDVVCDLLCADPPYGGRTHAGTTQAVVDRFAATLKTALCYASWTPDDVVEFVAFWSPRTRGWMACMTSHDLMPAWEAAYTDAGRLAFAPVPILQDRVRMGGDGPASGAVYLMVARPRRKEFLSWGALPGWYKAGTERNGHIGGKPLDLMRALIRDYSRPGDLVCDPCAGGATTLLAAAQTGRRGVGAELSPETYAKAAKRLRDTPVAVDWLDVAPKGEQGGLW
jgi:site-specific DNA-methyltransferase (adenine-specific)